MKISPAVLRQYTAIPSDLRELRDLLDDVGIEVKKLEDSEVGPVFNLELLANRGDHACYAGVAREIVGRTGGELALPEIPALALARGNDPGFPVEIRVESELCLQYTGTLMERVGPSEDLPPELLRPLIGTGIHSISTAVDATNLSNLELGQPTHVFDADKIDGAVVIRLSVAGERAWPLFQEERVDLPAGTLVIADDHKILAVAGVIGCEDSKVTDDTQRVLVESATFDPVKVRLASRALEIHTDSSSRFERGADPSMATVGAARVVDLLERFGGFRRSSATRVVGDWADPGRVIALDIPTAAAFLEYPLTPDEVADRLERYGFTVATWPRWNTEDGWTVPDDLSRVRQQQLALVRVPPGRLWDVEYPDDLYEELAKSIGYNDTPEGLPPVHMGAVPSDAQQVRAAASDVLVGAGFYEVITDGFYGRDLLELLQVGEDHPLWAHVETQNALDRGYSLLKNNALGQAVLAVAANERRRQRQVRQFEWTRTFHPDATAPNGVCTERRLLWAIASGPLDEGWDSRARAGDAWFVRGVVEELGVALSLPLEVGPADPNQPLASALHPGRQAAVHLDGVTVGLLGEVHPAVLKAARIKRARPVYLELDAAALETPARRPTYVTPDDLQPILRSLAFTLPHGVPAGEIAEHLRASGPAWLRAVDVADLYAHTEDGAPVRTVTFALTYDNDEARTADEVNTTSEYLVQAIAQRFGPRGVKLRA